MPNAYLLAIDQGTTSTRAVVYDDRAHCLGSANKELEQHYPQPGWVEHDAEEIWQSVADVVPRALAAAKIEARQITAIGLTNQRETSLFWQRADGKPIGRALVWQDRRTADECKQRQAHEPWLYEKTGLVLDPYFSATKMSWVLNQHPELRQPSRGAKVACGTIDSFLIFRLTGGKVHATDVTNASRTLLMDLRTSNWEYDLCDFFAVPHTFLPEVCPSAADYGVTAELGFLPAGIPILGVAGDQQAALFGQGAYGPGEAKCTYGTGAFFLQHTGDQLKLSRHRLLCTMAATLDEKPQYAVEGSVFIAGAAVQWLRDGLKVIRSAAETEALSAQSNADEPILMVPGFVGLGAPHWKPDVRGAILGITRGTGVAELARAALEGVAYQVVDLIEASQSDSGQRLQTLRVDGGMAQNDWFLQRQADLLGIPVLAAAHQEATALGAALLAGWKAGVWTSIDALRALATEGRRFQPTLPESDRLQRIARWRRAVQKVIEVYE